MLRGMPSLADSSEMIAAFRTEVLPGTVVTARAGVVYELQNGAVVNIPPGYIVRIIRDILHAEPAS